MIREARPNDVPWVVGMGDRFIRETEYKSHISGDPNKMRELVEALMANPDGLLLVYDNDGMVDGMMGVLMFRHPMSDQLVASEMFWWVEPEARGSAGVRMLRMAEEWARLRGAERMMMIAPTDRVGEFYERVGYGKVETSYMRVL